MRNVSLLRWLLLLAGVLLVSSAALAQVSVGISVHVGPPALPVYEQPACPGDGFIWIPGYWYWGPDGYFWVPGTWVIAPRVGVLWTPGYWGWGGGVYIWHPGYWGPHIGFYGGINYGFGYTGVGYAGGYWRGGAFVYNRAVTNVNVTVVHNTYNQTVINNNVAVNRVSYNGGAAVWPPGRRRPNNPQPASSTLPRPHCNLSTNAPPATIELCSRRQITEGPQLPLRLSRASLADAMSWPHARRLRMAVPASARRPPPLRLAVKDGLLHESKIEAKVPQGMPAPMSRGLNVRPSGTLSPSSPAAIGSLPNSPRLDLGSRISPSQERKATQAKGATSVDSRRFDISAFCQDRRTPATLARCSLVSLRNGFFRLFGSGFQ